MYRKIREGDSESPQNVLKIDEVEYPFTDNYTSCPYSHYHADSAWYAIYRALEFMPVIEHVDLKYTFTITERVSHCEHVAVVSLRPGKGVEMVQMTLASENTQSGSETDPLIP